MIKEEGNPGTKVFKEYSSSAKITEKQLPRTGISSPVEKSAVPSSSGYLVVDINKCAGCMSCMLACSLAHEGKESLFLSRIQVRQNPFQPFPHDIKIFHCRQCVNPLCFEVCPTDALCIDSQAGNIRIIDHTKCVAGCNACVVACPYKPSRVIWDYKDKKAIICDLCATAHYWSEQRGPDGKQACIEICPMGALALTKKPPL